MVHDELQKYEKKCLFLRQKIRPGINSQKMEADTLIKIDTTSLLHSIVFPDTSIIMLSDWKYSRDSISFLPPGSWLDNSKMSFSKCSGRNSMEHEGIVRTNKLLSDSLLIILLFFEIVIVAYLIKSGISHINNSIKNVFVSSEKGSYSMEPGGKDFQSGRYLWALSPIIIALIAPVLVNAHNGHVDFILEVGLLFRFFIYVLVYFMLKNLIFFVLGNIFFSKCQTQRWISWSRTILSFYALILTPVLVSVGIGIQMSSSFIFAWVIGFLIIAKFWLLIKSAKIFSVRKGDILYLILYLCALEILPILLFYKGLFLL